MRQIIVILILISVLCVPVSATEPTAPPAPKSALPYMPQEQESFGEGLFYILKTAFTKLKPEFAEASKIVLSVIVVVLLISILQTITEFSQNTVQLTGAVIIGILLLSPINTLVHLGSETIVELTDYSKLLLPVMTSAMAAHGGITSSSAIYTGTVAFNALLTTVISKIMIPALYIFLCICIANSAIQNDTLKRIKSFIKWAMTWALKIVLYVFTGYMSITGVVSGAVDASALKATKLTISGAVPVIGNILSDASETILISSSIVKNSAGLYGIFAVIAVCIGPFLHIGLQYILLKISGGVCGVFGYKPLNSLVEDFSTGMGFILAITGSVCIMLLISLVCFMRGIGI